MLLRYIFLSSELLYSDSRFLVSQMVKNLPAIQKTWVQSLGQKGPPGEGNSNPLQYSCLENPVDRGTWHAIVNGVAKSWMSPFAITTDDIWCHFSKFCNSFLTIHCLFHSNATYFDFFPFGSVPFLVPVSVTTSYIHNNVA